MDNLFRVRDSTFLYKELVQEKKVKKFFEIREKGLDPSLCHRLAEIAALRINKNQSTRFCLGDRKWKIVREETSLLWRMIARIIPFFNSKATGGNEKYSIEPAWFARDVEAAKETPYFEKPTHDLAAFTAVATEAFQTFEKDFCAKDDASASETQYRIVKVEEGLKLVHKNSAIGTHAPFLKAAVHAYRQQLEQYLGKEKVADISYLYQIDWENLQCLTPEHVYRMNIGSLNTEISDLEKTLPVLQQMLQANSFDAFKNTGNLPGRVWERISRFDAAHFAPLKEASSRSSEWTQEQFELLLSLHLPTKLERKEAYTGKKIRERLSGSYATAQHNSYKPWVDQQELSQIFSKLEKAPSWLAYQEILAHVVSRKHLARDTAEGSYRVGALLPAPRFAPNGDKQEGIIWYKVSSCISNGYTYSYTLEPVVDTSSATIKLCRNTAPHYAALFGAWSLVHDFNYFTSPGSMGFESLKEHEEAFFKNRTIPTWVGYLELAKKKKEQPADAIKFLEKAFQELEEEKARKEIVPLTMKQILRKHNVILMEYMKSQEGKYFGILSSSYRTLRGYIQKYLISKLPSDKGDIAALEKIFQQIDFKEERLQKLKSLLLKDLAILETPPRLSKKVIVDDINKAIETLDQAAAQQGENISSKIACDLHLSGHSLGGATGSIYAARMIAAEGRMTLPGKQLHIYCFGDPGIDEEDNEAFMQWGNKHVDLFNESQVKKVHLYRRQTASDFIPLGGEEHLGAVFSSQDDLKLKKWLHFDATVLEQLAGASVKDMIGTFHVHEARFGFGYGHAWQPLDPNKPVDLEEIAIYPMDQGFFNNWKKVQTKNAERKYYNLLEDKWSIPYFMLRFLNEERRKIPDYFSRSLVNCFLLDQKKGHLPTKNLDALGNFVVRSLV